MRRCANYEQLLTARVLVGVGEAAYGSVGIAVIIGVFPKHLRATLTGTFMAGGLAGQVLGVGIGGAVAASHGWRMAFYAIGIAGLVLAVAYALCIRDSRCSRIRDYRRQPLTLASLKTLCAGRSSWRLCRQRTGSCRCRCLPAWLPTYFVRYYDLSLEKAAPLAAVFLAIGGAGMVCAGLPATSSSKDRRAGRDYQPACALLPRYWSQPLLRSKSAGHSSCCSASQCFSRPPRRAPRPIVAALTPAALHGTAFAVLTLANNFFGLAPGPILTGWLADRIGLVGRSSCCQLPASPRH